MQAASRTVFRVALLGALSASACGPGDPAEPSDTAQSTGGSGTGGSGPSGDAGSKGTGGAPIVSDPRAATRVARLTHTQYRNTVSDLFGIQDDVASGFAPDAQNGFRFDSSINYVVDSRLGGQYRTAAEALAAKAVQDDTVFAKIVPCDDASTSCRDQFVSSFGLRAFRRPLSTAEQARFGALFDQGNALIGSGDALSDGVSLVVEAMLESPDFLYRGELGSGVTPSGRIRLSNHEIASRLSYFLYDSMPDDELFRAAEEEDLTDPVVVEEQVKRLLEGPRTLAHLVHFHEQVFDFGRYSRISLDPDAFADVPADLAARALVASKLFLEDVISSEGGLSEMLTAPYAYADSELGPMYGVEVAGDFERVDFDAGERTGLLTQIGFLASHAYSKKTDPIHRGLFVARDLLCVRIPDPPAGASMTPPPEGAPTPKTTREEVDILTSQDGCINCHSIINPPGFAFENFDAAGRVRETEGDTSVSTDGVATIDGSDVAFAGAKDLLENVAKSSEAQRCYQNKWFDFAHGRELTQQEADALIDIPERLSVRELVARIAQHESFLTRSTDEVAP